MQKSVHQSWDQHVAAISFPIATGGTGDGTRGLLSATATRVGTGIGITVRDVVKEFDARAALRGVSIDVEPGELLALLGPSGSGKTTLLRIIAGLENHESGSVAFDGRATDGLSVGERGVGLVFQHYALFRHMTVFDNVAYGLKVRKRATRPTGDDIRRRVLSLLDLVQLGGLERRYPAQLSGGQRQRVALARALAIDPRVLLLDEPFGALDARVRKDLRRWLREIHEKTGQTTIFVTHDQDEAMELADRVAILNAGRIEQIGRPADIYAHPLTAFAASFVGNPTALDVVVAASRVQLGRFDVGPAPGGFPDGPARLFVRPGDAVLSRASDDGVPGRLQNLLWASRGVRADVTIEGVARYLEVDLPDAAGLEVGDTVSIRLETCECSRRKRSSSPGRRVALADGAGVRGFVAYGRDTLSRNSAGRHVRSQARISVPDDQDRSASAAPAGLYPPIHLTGTDTWTSATGTVSIGSSAATPPASLPCSCTAARAQDRRRPTAGCSIPNGTTSWSSTSAAAAAPRRMPASRRTPRGTSSPTSNGSARCSGSTAGSSSAARGDRLWLLPMRRPTPSASPR